jgi:hypothetical protein
MLSKLFATSKPTARIQWLVIVGIALVGRMFNLFALHRDYTDLNSTEKWAAVLGGDLGACSTDQLAGLDGLVSLSSGISDFTLAWAALTACALALLIARRPAALPLAVLAFVGWIGFNLVHQSLIAYAYYAEWMWLPPERHALPAIATSILFAAVCAIGWKNHWLSKAPVGDSGNTSGPQEPQQPADDA